LSILKIATAKIFEPLLARGVRYRGAFGGRGSGKSHFFGELLVELCQAERGTSAVCIREAQKTLAQSSKRLIESKIAGLGLGHRFKIFSDKIATPGGGVIIFRGMQDHTADSIKSLEGFRIAWVDEAQSLSARSLSLLRPTIRAKNSELWASWNPRRRSDAIDDFFRTKKPDGAVIVNANWRDNPWFPAVLEDERRTDLLLYSDRYEHVWIRILDYYESVGQVLAFHVNWMRERGYGRAINILPHDGVNENNIIGKKYADHWRDAGFSVEPPVKNQGKGAAMMRIEAVRRLGPKMWWNEATTEAGRDAVGFYHEKKDDVRNVGLGPEHDWSSHAADALGLMAICYEEPGRNGDFNRAIRYREQGWV